MDLGIQGKRALIGGASKGLGFAVARALAQEGVALTLVARNPQGLAQAAERLQPLSAFPVQVHACDLTQPQERGSLIGTLHAQGVSPQILIHNIGGPPPTRAEETTLAQWREGFERLFLGVVEVNDAFLPAMKAQGWGRIVLITSSAVYEPVPGLAISNAMRAAITNWAKTLADELAPTGVTINCAAPGVIYTDRTEERVQAAMAREGGAREDWLARYAAEIPMGRLGTPDEYAAMVAFLCSRQASYVTGATWAVDGGKRRSAV